VVYSEGNLIRRREKMKLSKEDLEYGFTEQDVEELMESFEEIL
jgi:hypothetical protein